MRPSELHLQAELHHAHWEIIHLLKTPPQWHVTFVSHKNSKTIVPSSIAPCYALPLHPPVTYLPAPAGSSLSVVNPRGIVTSHSSRAQPQPEDPNQNPNSASKSLPSELHSAPANLVAFRPPPIPSSFARLAPFLWLISVAFVARMVSSRPLPLRFAAVLLEAFFT